MKPISTLVYTNLVAFKLLPPLPPRMDPSSSSLQGVVIDQARVQDQTKDQSNQVWIKKTKLKDSNQEPMDPLELDPIRDSKRRKELALKALEERMLKKKG